MPTLLAAQMATFYRKCWCQNGISLPQNHTICQQNVMGVETCAKCYAGYSPTPQYGTAVGAFAGKTDPNGACLANRANPHSHAAIGTACVDVFMNRTVRVQDKSIALIDACGAEYGPLPDAGVNAEVFASVVTGGQAKDPDGNPLQISNVALRHAGTSFTLQGDVEEGWSGGTRRRRAIGYNDKGFDVGNYGVYRKRKDTRRRNPAHLKVVLKKGNHFKVELGDAVQTRTRVPLWQLQGWEWKRGINWMPKEEEKQEGELQDERLGEASAAGGRRRRRYVAPLGCTSSCVDENAPPFGETRHSAVAESTGSRRRGVWLKTLSGVGSKYSNTYGTSGFKPKGTPTNSWCNMKPMATNEMGLVLALQSGEKITF